MVLNSNLELSLRGRRPITLSQELLANLVGRVPHPTRLPGGNRSLGTNVTGNFPVTPLQQTLNTGRGIPRLGTRDSITPSSLSLGIQLVNQPSPAQTGHAGSVNPGLPHLELPQSVQNYTPISGQGPITVGNESSGYSQMTPYPSVPPSIVIESHEQQQVLLPGASLSRSGRGQLSSPLLEPFHQNTFSISQQRNNTQDQLLPDLRLILVEGWNVRVLAKVDQSVYNSCIFRDALPGLLKRVDWERFLCPWPPNHPTFTAAGFNSYGGECIQLSLRNGNGQVVQLPLAVVDREEAHRIDIKGVDVIDVVLCQDYFSALAPRQTMPMSVGRQTGGIGYSNARYQWPVPGPSHNAINPTENPGYDYSSPIWSSSGNQMEGVQLHPQQLAPSFQNTVSSTSQSGSAAIVSSTTSPDMPFPMAGSMPISQNSYSHMSWQQLDKPGA
ncbi:hypothetical protein F4680DRAFT_66854 [Xylaria scruposa]|nr:hypothetical protein F4680DRAFT_66854 [Xylaria scruposa]